MRRAAAAAIVGLALWLSGAVFSPMTSGGAGWLAALPSWPGLAAAVCAAGLLVAWRPPPLSALLPLVAVLLPWVPGIDAGLIYAGPLMMLVWAAVLTLGWGAVFAGAVGRCGCATDARRATIAAFVIALAWTSLIAWRVAPMIPNGDEPHYLIVAQSLMKDGDLRVENNYAQRDYAPYSARELDAQYLVRGRDGAIYSVHAPGLPALLIPAFAAAGYPGAVIFLLVVMALASALVWRIAWLASGDIAAAWFGWAIVTASCTWAFQSFLVFPDALGAAAVACGLWLVLRLDRGHLPPRAAFAAVGAALAMLPWLHTRFAMLAAGLGLMIVWRAYRADRRHLAAFLAAPVAGAIAWFAFFQAIYGTPSPFAPWGSTGDSKLAWLAGGFAGLLFDQQFGWLPYAPALAVGIAGLAAGTSMGWARATGVQCVLLLFAGYVAVSASYAMWWAGYSVPARLMTVLLPLLAPAGAVLWGRFGHPVVRTVFTAALGWTIFATATLAFAARGDFAWNSRQHKAGLWFEWVAPLLAWTEVLPAFFRAADELGRESLPLPEFYLVIAIWIAVLAITTGAALLVARVMRRQPGWEAASKATAITALVLALPVATVLSLRVRSADGSSPARAQIAFLVRLSKGDQVVIDLARRRAVPAAEAMSSMRALLPAGAPSDTRSFGEIPAGRYRISAGPGAQPGEILIGRGQSVASLGDTPIAIALPVDVNALQVRGATDRALVLEPIGLLPRRRRQNALRAMRYGAVTAFFIDDRAYAEKDAFWVGGARFASVVLQADPGVQAAELALRNGPVPNHVAVTGAAQPFARGLAGDETLSLPVVFDQYGAAHLRIDSRSGFIPAQVDQTNRDRRYLGVYVKVREVGK